METDKMEKEEVKNENSDIELTSKSLDYLLSIRRWTRAFSVVGFVIVALLLLGMIIVGTSTDLMTSLLFHYGKTLYAIYLFIVFLLFIPLYGLYRFSGKIEEGILAKDPLTIEAAFRNMKISAQSFGILFLIVVFLYVLISIIGFITALIAY